MIKSEVKEIICRELKLSLSHFDGNEGVKFHELGIDSLDLIELCLLMEEKYNVQIDPHKNKFKTLNEVFVYLENHGLED